MAPLVDYQSSDDEELRASASVVALEESGQLKRKGNDLESESTSTSTSTSLPPLPPDFHNLYASNTRLSTRDDPSLHGGRTRATPHIQGNWPTHLYVEWYPSSTEYIVLDKIISDVQHGTSAADKKVETFLTSDLGAPLPLHISLSRPVGFSTEQKDNFLHALQRNIASSAIKTFTVKFTKLSWVPNFTQTRWFLVLGITKPPQNELNQLLTICNRIVEAYGQPSLYAEACEIQKSQSVNSRKKRRTTGSSTTAAGMDAVVLDRSEAFHVSVAWSLTPPDRSDEELLVEIVKGKGFKEVEEIVIRVEELKAKVGNEVVGIPWQSGTVHGKSLFGY